MQEGLSSVFANNNGTDQPAHPRSLIRTYIIPVLESIISKLATGIFFNFLASLFSCGDWFESHFVGNAKDRFCHVEAQIITITSCASSILFILEPQHVNSNNVAF